ncbi:ankyrin repeat domain-containing protein [Nonomuraea africana]|uniref:Ankyrin repeat protein n=1 Tax=Nonomuraea africana TaxID=46171 RepID=A0ABR9KDS1_9ACTN|nr:ankyrin repeat domain-containing protein [Nonomuraea africana]MBE1560178.1 ankyrin repeat protein [Nonomuraea africana]
MLPQRPNLDQLRRQAKELRDRARSGDTDRLGALPVTLASAQLVIAREHGFASWAKLKDEVERRTTDLAQRVEAFLEASVDGRTGRAVRLLAETPAIAGHDFRTAVVLGDAARVRDLLARDPGLATRPDQRSGWTPLLGVCNSRWHRIEPERAAGLVEVARLLLGAGADPNGAVGSPGRRGHCSPLYAAAGLAGHPALARLLLEHGADPDTPAALYHTAFHDGDHACLRLLLEHGARAEGSATLGAAISVDDAQAVRLLLEAGVDPRVPLPADSLAEVDPATPPIPAVTAALEHDCSAELIEVLLERGADARAEAHVMAVRRGRTDVADLLTRYGARDDTGGIDRFLGACVRADRAEAERLRPPLDRLGTDDLASIVHAAYHDNAAAVDLMLDLGFPLDARGDDGATALHAAAAAGGLRTVRLLLARGADLEAVDTTWGSTPLTWASVGSGFRMGHAEAPDWVAVVQTLIEAGASPHEPWVAGKPPSGEVGALLRRYGLAPENDEDEAQA